MVRIVCFALISMFFYGCSMQIDPVDFVDPMVGTGFHGHTFPGATVPFGMVQLSPDTRVEGWDACSGYHYSDSVILGFSHTHLSGTGCADLADILFYPSSVSLSKTDGLYARPPHAFTHEDERASCGYYSVDFRDSGISVELTAAPRTGVHRYTFKGKGERHLLIDLMHVLGGETIDMHDISAVSGDEVAGMRRTQGWVSGHYVFFSAKFSVPFENIEIIDGRQAYITFPAGTDTVVAAVALSSVSTDNAAANRLAEVPELDFDKIRGECEDIWRKELQAISVKGGSGKDMANFYTSLYHTKMCPNIMNDVNGEYRRNDGTVSFVPEGRKYYSTFSLWDTYRAWHPLQTMTDTSFVNDMIWSMLDMYDCSGELPIWPLASGETGTMIGYHAVSVIADAYLKGIRGFDSEKALEAMVRSSRINKKGSDLYMKNGYVPANIKPESVSLTLEYAYDDWCIARMAEAMGKSDISEEYSSRAGNYMNVFDGSTSFFRGHSDDGSWTEPFDVFSTGRDYTEATPWHYRFAAVHDVKAMEQLFGGRDKFIGALDDLFSIETDNAGIDLQDVTGIMGQYAHGNEPSHHMAYLYCWEGMPWKTQSLVRKLLDEMYSPVPEGIIGNEDCGQMSAWYIFSSMGFYPVCPGSGQFVLGSPLFREVSVRLADGNVLKIKADGPRRNVYVKNVSLNGEAVRGNYITYDMLMKGGELDFDMSSVPEYGRGTGPDDSPYSMTRDGFVSIPCTASPINLFSDNVTVSLATLTDGAEIRYTLDGSEPSHDSALYEEPFTLTESAVIRAKAYKQGLNESRTVAFNAVKAEYMPSKNVSGLENGVRYEYHKGRFPNVAEMRASAVHSRGTMPYPSIDYAPDEDYFGYIFRGYVDVPEKGVWEFMTKSDDGSVLYIDGVKVVNNDGSHAAVAATGRIALDKGFHRFELQYFEDYEGQELKWGWRKSGEAGFSAIPSERLYCR